MGRVVLQKTSRTVTGNVKLPNGAVIYDNSNFPPTLVRKDNTWQASCSIRVACCGVEFYFTTDTGMGYGWGPGSTPRVSASMRYIGRIWVPYPPPNGSWLVTQMGAGVDFDDHQQKGRGIDGAYIEGSFSVHGEAELCLYTFGEDMGDDPTPELQYPNYGGSRQVGEFPTNHCRLVWEWIGKPTSASISLGGRSKVVEPYQTTTTDTVDFAIHVTDDSWEDSGGVEATVSYGGIPVEDDTRWVAFKGRHDNNPSEPLQDAAKVEVGVGFARVMNRGWCRSSVLEACSAGVGGTLYVPRVADWKGDAYAFDKPHPSNDTKWHLLHRWQWVQDPDGNPETENIIDFNSDPVPVYETLTGQSVAYSIKQNGAFVNWSLYNKAVESTEKSSNWQPVRVFLNGNVIHYAHGEYEFGPVQVHLTPPPGEDPKDWRCGFRGRRFPAFQVNHRPMLDIGGITWNSQGDGWWLGTLPYPLNMEGYRYLRAEAGVTNIQIGSKKWSIPEGEETNFDVDLCCPDNATIAIDAQTTRWPLDVNLRPTIEGQLWGVNYATTIRVRKPGSVKPTLKLVRKHYAKVNGLEAFQDWQEWKPPVYHENSGGSSGDWYEYYNVQRIMIGNVDNRQSFEAFDVLKITNTASGRKWQDDYFHRSCADVANQIIENPAYNITLGGKVDDYHNPSAPAWFLGQGFTVANGQWYEQFGVGDGAWSYGQAVVDSCDWRDVVGDVWNVGNGGGQKLQLRSRKVFRSNAYGVVHDHTTDQATKPPSPPLPVLARDNGGDEARLTVNTEAASGDYQIGPTLSTANKWGNVAVKISDEPVKETGRSGVGGVPRKIQRVSFRLVLPAKGAAPSVDVTNDGIWLRAFIKDGKLVTGFANRTKPGQWTDKEQDIKADSVCLRAYKHSRNQTVWIQYAFEDKDAGQPSKIFRRTSHDNGKTWGEPQELRNGKLPAFIHTDDGHRVDYWQDGDKIKGQLFDRFNKPLKTKGGTTFDVVSGVDDSTGVAVDCTVIGKGKRQYGMLLVMGGEIKFFTSGDAIAWSPATE